ncbi:MAG: SDR family NAD(P)-dependent oxidoreductase, partial [Candidatus Electrothrix sp. EH2]|nr:SDR family NAD(P)-dependent oxidoreductase [Candidatus Electrothrix sp. EH2]
FSWLNCRHIDLPLDTADKNSAHLLAENADRNHEPETAWRDAQRSVMRLEKVLPELKSSPVVSLQQGGFYLITGGLGGIGVEIARFLLEQYAAELLLIGQTPFAEIDIEDGTDLLSTTRLRAWKKLQTLPGKVQYQALDVGDAAALEQAVAETEAQWQTGLSGIIHLAGTAHEKPLSKETDEGLAATLHPKLAGASAVHRLLENRPEAFTLFFSSITGFFADSSTGAYAAANSFLDYFAAQQQVKGHRSYSLAWSMWDDIGMSRHASHQTLLEAKGYHLISAADGIRSMLVGLAQGHPCLLAGLNDTGPHIRQRLRDYRNELSAIETVLEQHPDIQQAAVIQDSAHNRLNAYLTPAQESVPVSPALDAAALQAYLTRQLPDYTLQPGFSLLDKLPLNADGEIDRKALEKRAIEENKALDGMDYVAPRNAEEKRLVSIWAGILGIEQIGIRDNFFALGGASLQAIQCLSRINQSLSLELLPTVLFENPTIEALALEIRKQQQKPSEVTSPTIIQKQPADTALTASFAQQRLWFLDSMDAAAAYNIPVALELKGDLDIPALQMALNTLIQRHQVLRTAFIDDKAHLKLQNIDHFPLQQIDLRQTKDNQTKARQYAREDACLPFDLKHDLLFRATLLQLADNHYTLLLNIHHIAADGWSISVLAQELRSLYNDFHAGRPASLTELPIQYSDFAAWQRQTLQGQRLETLLDYWKNQLNGLPPLLQLPTDFPHPETESYQGRQHDIHIPEDLTEKLQQLGRQNNATLFMTLMAVFNILLYRYSGQHDLVVGTPVAARNRSELEPLIGFFANTLALRTRLNPADNFNKILQQVRKTAQDAYNHQEVPFEKLVEELQIPRSLAYNPLVQVMFALQTASADEFSLADIKTQPLKLPGEYALFDLELHLWESETGLQGHFLYKTGLFDQTSIQRMVSHFECLLKAVTSNPTQSISRLSMLTEQEIRQLQSWNDTAADFPKHQTIVDLFEQQVKKTPDNIAVVFEEQQLTYREL